MRVAPDAAEMHRLRQLVQEENDLDEAQPSSAALAEAATAASPMSAEDGTPTTEAVVATPGGNAEDEERGEEGGEEGAPPADLVGETVAVASRGAELPEGRQPVLASRGRYEVTSRDRLFLQLARLPERFHAEVAGAFGARSLIELTAARLASELAASNTPPSALRAAGYPEHIVAMVKRLITSQGATSID